MKVVTKDTLDRIIVKDNARMQQIIDWYFENQEYLESQPFKMPFKQGLICLKEENIEFSFETISETDVRMKIYMEPDGKDVFMCEFRYNPVEDIITEKIWPTNLPLLRLNMLKILEVSDTTCKKEAFKYRVLMYYAVYYTNEVVVDKKAEKPLDKCTRKVMKRKSKGPVPLVRNTYVLEPNADSLKKPMNPDKTRHYEKPDHEVTVKGYHRKNGTWVESYTRYKDKSKGSPKTYKV